MCVLFLWCGCGILVLGCVGGRGVVEWHLCKYCFAFNWYSGCWIYMEIGDWYQPALFICHLVCTTEWERGLVWGTVEEMMRRLTRLRCFSYVSSGRIAFAVTTNSLECTSKLMIYLSFLFFLCFGCLVPTSLNQLVRILMQIYIIHIAIKLIAFSIFVFKYWLVHVLLTYRPKTNIWQVIN